MYNHVQLTQLSSTFATASGQQSKKVEGEISLRLGWNRSTCTLCVAMSCLPLPVVGPDESCSSYHVEIRYQQMKGSSAVLTETRKWCEVNGLLSSLVVGFWKNVCNLLDNAYFSFNAVTFGSYRY